VGSVFVVAMSLSYTVGALIALGLAVNRCGLRWVPQRSDLFQRIGSESYFCFATFLNLKFRAAEAHCIAHAPVPHAAHRVTNTHKCGVIHASSDTILV
jgi:hypothetical protein